MTDGPRTAVVLIASTRAAAGVYPDRAGPLLAEWLRHKGFRVAGPIVRPDGPEFAAALAGAVGGAAGGGADSGAADSAVGSGTGGAAGADVDSRVGGAAGSGADSGVADSAAVRAPNLVITSGGTGISPTDVTPQITAPLLDYEIPGLAEALRRRGTDAGIPTAALSRGLVGVAGRTLVINLPGSTGGVKDGIAVLDTVLDHALEQIAGGDH